MTIKKQHQITIMFTGGHVTPAIATIEEIKRRFPAWRMVFVGRMYALEGNREVSEEYRLVTGLGIRFLPIIAGRFKRDGGLLGLFALLKVPIGFASAMAIIVRERPSSIVSFGGYVALPVALAGYVLGVPVVTHEQTTCPGLANRVIARIADRVCVSFPETVDALGGKNKVTVTGLPIRASLFTQPKTPPFSLPSDIPIVLIVGGSTGSVCINDVVFAALVFLLPDFTVIHQVGRISQDRSVTVSRSLPDALRKRYIAKAYLSAPEYSWALHHAKVVIGRSGANTVMELALTAAVALCIPLPWSANHEQLSNARYLESGGATILPQHTLTPDTLRVAVRDAMVHWQERKTAATRLSLTVLRDGARRFVRIIEQVVIPE